MSKSTRTWRDLLRRFGAYKPAGILSVLLLFTLIFTLLAGRLFLTRRTISVLARLLPERGIIAVGITALMIAREFDLSVGSVSAFCAWILASLYTTAGLHPAIAIAVALLSGILMGGLNGLITLKLKIHSFIATLGTMMMWRGLLLLASNGRAMTYQLRGSDAIFKELLVGTLREVPVQMLWYVVVTVALWTLLEHTPLGNWIFATGSSPDAARAMGIDTDKVKLIAFLIGGGLSALGGIVQCSRSGLVSPFQGTGMELDMLGAILIGGTLLTGGVGSVLGTFVGLLLIHLINIGTVVLRASGYLYQVIVGALLIIGVGVNQYIEEHWR